VFWVDCRPPEVINVATPCLLDQRRQHARTPCKRNHTEKALCGACHEGSLTVGLYPNEQPGRSSFGWPRPAPPSPA